MQKLSKILIVDASSLISLERVELLKFLDKITFDIKIPKSVSQEMGNILHCKNIQVEELKGKSLKLSRSLENIGIGKGEAECIALAHKFGLKFIICDDRKLIRQIFFSQNRIVREIKILGFSFFLHLFYQKNLIKDVWDYFSLIIEKNNWKRSEVQVANYTFLKEMGY